MRLFDSSSTGMAVLLQSGGREVPWSDFLREFTARHKTNWTEVKTSIIQAVTGQQDALLSLFVWPNKLPHTRAHSHAHTELFTLALPHVTGRDAIYSVGLLVKYPSLAPLITGVQPLSIFPNSPTATQCLNLLVGRERRDVGDNFVKLLPYHQN